LGQLEGEAIDVRVGAAGELARDLGAKPFVLDRVGQIDAA
jgi:hypothetical protein